MRRKAFAVAGGFVLAAVLIAACSSSSSNSGGDSGPKTMTDPLVIETSDATRAELGVKLWGVRLDTDGTMAVHGYDGANNAIVEIRQSNFATDEWQSTVTMSVAGLGANAKMTSRIESTPSFSESPDEPATLDFTMMENSFDSDARARRIAELLQGDANASPPHPNTGGGLTQSYHVNDLVKDSGGLYDASDALANSDADAALVNQCTNLTDTCKASISLLAKDSVGGLSQCSLIAKGAPIHLECAADDKDCKPPAGANVPPQTQACADAAKKAGTTTDDSQKKCPTKCDSTGAPAAGDGGGGGGGNDGGGGGGGGGSDDAGTGGGDSDNVKVQRALEWVNVSMPYCQAANNAYDSTCARTCTRTGAADKPEWNSYRSDCSGLISYAWGLPAPGLTTAGFAPYGNGATTVDASTIQVGDALNKKPRGHIILFAGWVDQASGLARIIEEPNCKSHAIDHQSTLTANGATFKRSGTEYVPIRQ